MTDDEHELERVESEIDAMIRHKHAAEKAGNAEDAQRYAEELEILLEREGEIGRRLLEVRHRPLDQALDRLREASNRADALIAKYDRRSKAGQEA